MRTFKKAAIIGTGLIGGSLGLELRKRKIARQVVGVSRKPAHVALAKKIGAVDAGSTSLEIIRGADLVVFAASIEAIITLAPKVRRLISRDALVTDVGSTKEEITARLSKIFPGFVGGHPLAGSEKRSIAAAQKGLFGEALVLLTPVRSTDKAALSRVKALWQALGSWVELIGPKEHDRLLAYISHLPHAAAYALINSIPGSYVLLGAAGLKDTTRIAGSDPQLWAQILLSNKENVSQALLGMEREVAKIRKALKKGSPALLAALFAQAQKKRKTLK